jgi:hypothetical protein
MTEMINGTKLRAGDVCVVYLSTFANNEKWTILLIEKVKVRSKITEWRYVRLTPETTTFAYTTGPLLVVENDPNEFEVLERLPLDHGRDSARL